MLVKSLICCILAILGCNANLNNVALLAALNQDPLGLGNDVGCMNPAAYKKTVLLNQVTGVAGNVLGGQMGLGLGLNNIYKQNNVANLLGGNQMNQVVLASLLNNNMAKNSVNVLGQVLAARLGNDYSDALLNNDVVDLVAGNPLINQQALLLNQVNNPLAAVNQLIDLQPEVNALGNLKPQCVNNLNCLAKTEVLTQVVAENVCSNNLVGNKVVEAKIACNAGALVGKTVAQVYGKACEVAGQQFQQKTQQCVSDACITKEAFVACCKNEKDAAKGIIQTAALFN